MNHQAWPDASGFMDTYVDAAGRERYKPRPKPKATPVDRRQQKRKRRARRNRRSVTTDALGEIDYALKCAEQYCEQEQSQLAIDYVRDARLVLDRIYGERT